MTKKFNVLSTNYNDIKEELKTLIKSYYSDNFNNFSDNSLGMLYINSLSSVSEMLTFYINSAFNESMLSSATVDKNIYALANSHGYKPILNTTSICELSVTLTIPVDENNNTSVVTAFNEWYNSPSDTPLLSINGNGLIFYSGNIEFRTNNMISFQRNNTTIDREFDEDNNIKNYILTTTIPVFNLKVVKDEISLPSNPIKYWNFDISDDNIVGIKKIYLTDSEYSRFYEVNSLAQNTILIQDEKTGKLKNKWINNKFKTTVKDKNTINVMFGTGEIEDTTYFENFLNIPTNGSQNFYGNPSTFLYSKSYGTTPSDISGNTRLVVEYYVSDGVNGNVAINTIEDFNESDSELNFNVYSSFITNQVPLTLKNIQVTNNQPSFGGGDVETDLNIKENVIKNIKSQNRLVSINDFKTKVLNMPSQYGKISNVYVKKNDEKDFNIDLYVLSKNMEGYTNVSQFAKENLKTYLEKYRILTDTINILDTYIVNVQVTFQIAILKIANKNIEILNTINVIRDYFKEHIDINTPINISDLKTTIISELPNVTNVNYLNFKNIYNTHGDYEYSGVGYSIDSALVNDVIYPPKDIAIFEIKYYKQDINGSAVVERNNYEI